MGRGISCDGSAMINPVAVNEDRASKCPETGGASLQIAGPPGQFSHPTPSALRLLRPALPARRSLRSGADLSAVPDGDAAAKRSQRVDPGGAVPALGLLAGFGALFDGKP